MLRVMAYSFAKLWLSQWRESANSSGRCATRNISNSPRHDDEDHSADCPKVTTAMQEKFIEPIGSPIRNDLTQDHTKIVCSKTQKTKCTGVQD
jgi:hypothetical protein